jgi:hypothetical protein
MGLARNWKEEEYNYLQEHWGNRSLRAIAKSLNRTSIAVKIKVARLGLGSFLSNGEYVSYNQLLKAIGKFSYSYTTTSWIKNRGFPVKNKTVNKCNFRVVYIKDFWIWAEKNKSFINWSKFVENCLGEEPDWVEQQRKLSISHKRRFCNEPWTEQEDSKLRALLKQYRYGYKELSVILNRTSGAIQRRCCDLKLKERPVKADNKIKWTEQDKVKLHNMILSGYSYEDMAKVLDKSSKAIRGTVYRIYTSENLDKVRGYISDYNIGGKINAT